MIGTGFDQHGITHLSPSSINLWINAPDRWVAEKLFGRRAPMGPAARRGIAVEAAVVDILRGEAVMTAVDVAETKFDLDTPVADERDAKERDMIAPCTEQALKALAVAFDVDAALDPYGDNAIGDPIFDGDGRQIKVAREVDLGEAGLMTFIGYLDLVWPGRVVDIKTTSRIMTTMPIEHQRQRAFYRAATGARVQFIYASPKKFAVEEQGDEAQLLAEMKWHAQRLERLLRDRTKEEVAALVPVNTGTFYWNGAEGDATEIFGMPRVA